ncbi:MAG: ATP phosphoribosyltransferase regulatory subunit [Oscillospiraceae bacterium]|nr:ATP phosphoribosyltransferase regulatory subunit [Oscillospiraceae bacterium]
MGDVNFLLTYQAGKSENTEETRGASRMVDTACRQNGVYTLLDNRQGRLFTYNRTGELLFVSGGSGQKRDELLAPTAVDYWGDSLIVADQGSKSVKVFSPTAYAEQVLSAIDYHELGDYEREAEIWEVVKREYIGSELAYLGLGKAEYTLKNYTAAMENFKLANNKEYYSKAYKAYRKDWGYQNIGWLLGGAAVACVGIALLVRLTRKKIAACMEDKTYAENLQRIVSTVEKLSGGKYGISYCPSLVRGQGYYTGVVFEITCKDFPGAIAGGGRYDGMIGKFLGQNVSAVGFSIGFERICAILMDQKYQPPVAKKMALLYRDDVDFAEVLLKAQRLQGEYAVTVLPQAKKLGKQLGALEGAGYAAVAFFDNEDIKVLGQKG